jgi:uncharacterized protein
MLRWGAGGTGARNRLYTNVYQLGIRSLLGLPFPMMQSAALDLSQLCLSCGLCCNGVIFADVKLQPVDDASRLRSQGLPVTRSRSSQSQPRFVQPCAALDGCRCRVYGDRPQHCRQFECVLFKSVAAGRTEPAAALRIVRTAHKRAAKVRTLLRELGDNDEQVSLGLRFRRMARGMQESGLDEHSAAIYGELTLAVHDLNLLISQAFYPGDADSDAQ